MGKYFALCDRPVEGSRFHTSKKIVYQPRSQGLFPGLCQARKKALGTRLFICASLVTISLRSKRINTSSGNKRM